MTAPCSDGISVRIRSVLGGRPHRLIRYDGRALRRAGVLIPLLERNGACEVLFIERTHQVSHHKGQIAFPGGRVEEGDLTIAQTVLREVHEEIGVAPEEIELLGRVDDATTVTTDYLVHALVGRLPYPYAFVPDPGEVAKIITIPLPVFHPRENRYRRDCVQIQGVTYQVPAYEYEGLVIWGATARILQNFMDIAGPALPLSETA